MASLADQRRLSTRARGVQPFRVMEVLDRADARRRAGHDVVLLCVGEPDQGTPEVAIAAAQRSMADGDVHYTSALGIPPLREAIAAMYRERLGVEVAPERVVVTTGASGALLLALAATVDPGEDVLLADPGYPCNRHFLRVLGSAARAVPVDADTAWQLTADRIAADWDDTTAGALVATPSNPTGTMVPPDELAAIAGTVDRLGGTLFVDEIYAELVYDVEPSTVLAATDAAWVINSFSKTFGMTGWRIGWLVCPEWAVPTVEALGQNLFISPPTPSQHAALGALSPAGWAVVADRVAEFRARRDVLVAGLRGLGIGVPVVPRGAFYVYADVSRAHRRQRRLVPRPARGGRRRGHPGQRLRPPPPRPPRPLLLRHRRGPHRARPRADGPVRRALRMATTPREAVEFDEDDLSGIVARMDELGPGGWINIVPELPQDLEVAPRGALSLIFGARGPTVPMATWTPPGSENPPRMTFGVAHGSGPRALARLDEMGLGLRPGWRKVQDHAKRGVVVIARPDESHEEVLWWLLAASHALTELDLPGQWTARVYAP